MRRRPISRVYARICIPHIVEICFVMTYTRPRARPAGWCVKSGTAGTKMYMHENVRHVAAQVDFAIRVIYITISEAVIKEPRHNCDTKVLSSLSTIVFALDNFKFYLV